RCEQHRVRGNATCADRSKLIMRAGRRRDVNKAMKIPTLIGTWLAALLPCLAMADAPSDAAVGEVDAILKFCVTTDHRLAHDAETYVKLLTGEASPGAR